MIDSTKWVPKTSMSYSYSMIAKNLMLQKDNCTLCPKMVKNVRTVLVMASSIAGHIIQADKVIGTNLSAAVLLIRNVTALNIAHRQ